MADNRDWSKTSTVQGMALWLMKKSGALAVVVLRPEESVAVVSDTRVRGADLDGMLYAHLPEMSERLEAYRAQEREKEVRRQIRSGVNG